MPICGYWWTNLSVAPMLLIMRRPNEILTRELLSRCRQLFDTFNYVLEMDLCVSRICAVQIIFRTRNGVVSTLRDVSNMRCCGCALSNVCYLWTCCKVISRTFCIGTQSKGFAAIRPYSHTSERLIPSPLPNAFFLSLGILQVQLML